MACRDPDPSHPNPKTTGIVLYRPCIRSFGTSTATLLYWQQWPYIRQLYQLNEASNYLQCAATPLRFASERRTLNIVIGPDCLAEDLLMSEEIGERLDRAHNMQRPRDLSYWCRPEPFPQSKTSEFFCGDMSGEVGRRRVILRFSSSINKNLSG